MAGLSFREYLLLKEGIEIEPVGLSELLQDHDRIARRITEEALPRPVEALRNYWREGYYPMNSASPLPARTTKSLV